MSTLVSFLVDRLVARGIKHIFGVPGDYILPFYNFLNGNQQIKSITLTSEIGAGFAADAYARLNGMSAVLVTYGVGGLSVINAVGGAFAEKSPMIIISGAPNTKDRNRDLLPHHSINSADCQAKIFSQVTCDYAVIRNMQTAAEEIDRVLSNCKLHKQPVYIEIPCDMIEDKITCSPYANSDIKPVVSDKETLTEAVDEAFSVLQTAKNPIIIAGVEIARFQLGKQLLQIAEGTKTPVATTILGKSVINEHHPLSMGVYCSGCSNAELENRLAESDCVMMLGVEMTDVSVGFVPTKVWRKNTITASCFTVQVKNHHYQKVKFIDFTEQLSLKVAKECEFTSYHLLSKREECRFVPVSNKALTTKRLFDKIEDVLTDKMAVIADVGDSMFGALNVRTGRNHFISPAFYNSMGFAIPGSIGMQFFNKEFRPLVITGDGSFQMSMNELSSVAKLGCSPIIIILNNNGYLTERLFVDGEFNDVYDWNYHEMPQALGYGSGMLVTTEDQLERAFNLALESDKLFIINAKVGKFDASSTLKKFISCFKKQ